MSSEDLLQMLLVPLILILWWWNVWMCSNNHTNASFVSAIQNIFNNHIMVSLTCLAAIIE